MIIRRATPADGKVIASVFQKAFGPFQHLYSPGAYAATAVPEATVLLRMQEGCTWVAEDVNQIIGTVSSLATWEGYYVKGMALLPEAQGKKVAYRLMTTLEECGKSQGHDRIYLYTTTFLDRAIRLYEKLGFTRYGNPKDHWMGTTVIQFEKFI